MKKTIFIEVLLAFVFCAAVATTVYFFKAVSTTLNSIEYLKTAYMDEQQRQELISLLRDNITTFLSYGIPSLLAALATVAAGILIALKDFPVFKPFVDRLAAKHAERKQRRNEQKTAQAEENRQARIASLQAELDELKKDE